MSLKTLVAFYLVVLFSINATAQNWQQIADFPSTERDDGTNFVIGNYAYCGTGLQVGWSTARDFYRFNFNDDSWDTIAAMPVGAERQYACAFSYNSLGYIFGGYNSYSLNDLWQYNPQSNSWIQKASKPGIGLSGEACFVINDKVFFVGGNNGGSSIYNTVWQYDITNDAWLQKNNFPLSGSWRASATAFNNKGYLLFGRDSIGNYNKQLYEYNPQTDTWIVLSVFPTQARIYSSLKAIKNTLVVFAGVDSLNNYYNNLWYFSFYDSLWYQGNALTAEGRKGGMCFNSTNDLYYTTGIDHQDNRLKETWKISNLIGVAEIENENTISFFPNPCADKLSVNSNENETVEIELLDITGNTVLQKKFTKNLILDFNEVANGVYLLKMKNKFTATVKKIVVAHL